MRQASAYGRTTMRPHRRFHRAVVTAISAVAFIVLAAAPASADTLSVNFETGPALHSPSVAGAPVTDHYLASSFVQFFAADPGFRPFRREVGSQAKSGTIVADVGGSVCFPDTGDAGGCEFVNASTQGQMTRSASSVTLYAGLFTPQSDVGVRLKGLSANGDEVAVSAVVPINATNFKTPVSVSSVAGDIQKFRLEAVATTAGNPPIGADLGFDDLTFDYPAGSLPNVSISAQQLTSVLNGRSTDVPINITRVNGSNGPLQMTATGMPPGVTAQVLPNPVPGTTGSAILRLTASDTAPRLDNPAPVTVTADPQSNANVAPAPRTLQIGVTVKPPFTLTTPSLTAPLATCSTTDVPFVLGRDITFNQNVALTTGTVPPGIGVEILPGTSIAPGGGLNVGGSLRLSVAPTAVFPATLQLTATSPGTPTRQLTFTLTRAAQTAVLVGPANVKTPQYVKAGTTVTVEGNGFCPGTVVYAGSRHITAAATPTIAPDGKSLTFETPRGATTGQVEVVPAPGLGLTSVNAGALTVDSFRNVFGFPFHNFGYGWVSYGELADAFGHSDMWVTVNPCWPWGSCRINTGIPDPTAYLAWGVINIAMKLSGGHCFGISRAVERIRIGKVSRTRFLAGATRTIDIGLNAELTSYLDGEHSTQTSKEFLTKWAHRDRSVAGQLATVQSELSSNRTPLVSIRSGSSGHAMAIYDQQFTPDGIDLYVHDSNRETGPNGDAGGAAASVIHITENRHKWSFNLGSETWTGGDDGSMFITSQSTVPDDPTLPGLTLLDDVPAMIFGSDGGAAQATGSVPNTETLPALDSSSPPGAAGFVVGDKPDTPLGATFTGAKDGTYNAVVLGQGFAGAVTDVATKAGVKDVAGGSGAKHELTFTSGQDRSLNMSLSNSTGGGAKPAKATSSRTGAAARAATASTPVSATIATRVDQGATDTAGLTKGGTLGYEHQGDPTSISFTITKIRENGGPVQFSSGPVKIAGGDKITAAPKGSDMKIVALTIKSKSGKTVRRALKNRAKAVAGLKLSKLTLAKGKGSRTVNVSTTISKLAPETSAAFGLVLKVKRGGRTVATKTVSDPAAVNAAKTMPWTLPTKIKKGRYTVTAEARLVVGGAKGGSVTARKTARITLK